MEMNRGDGQMIRWSQKAWMTTEEELQRRFQEGFLEGVTVLQWVLIGGGQPCNN